MGCLVGSGASERWLFGYKTASESRKSKEGGLPKKFFGSGDLVKRVNGICNSAICGFFRVSFAHATEGVCAKSAKIERPAHAFVVVARTIRQAYTQKCYRCLVIFKIQRLELTYGSFSSPKNLAVGRASVAFAADGNDASR